MARNDHYDFERDQHMRSMRFDLAMESELMLEDEDSDLDFDDDDLEFLR